MSTRSMLTLVVVFGVLAATYWWTGTRTESSVRRSIEARRLFESPPESITSIGLERPGQSIIEARRVESGWDLTQPYDDIHANHAAWDRIAGAIAALSNERSIDSQLEDSTAYGLDPPTLRVFVNTGAAITQLDFGKLDPTQAYRYVRTAEAGLFLSRAAAFQELNKSLQELRDQRVFVPGPDGFTRIQYHAAPTEGRPEPIDVTVERSPDGRWLITEPVEAIASQGKLNDLVTELQLLRARDFIDRPESLGDYGLAKPFAKLTATTAEGVSRTLHIGWIDDSQENAGLFAKIDGELPVFVIDASIIALLPESADAVREKRLFTREASQLNSFTYTDAEWTLRFEIGDSGGWQLVDPPVDDTDQLAVSTYIAILKQLEAQSFPSPAVAPEPRIALEFNFNGGLPTTEIALGGPVPGSDPAEIYAWQDNGTLITLPAQVWPLLKGEPFKFRNRNLFDFELREATVVSLFFEGVQYRFEREGNRWRVTEPAGLQFESQDDARAILEAMRDVKAVAVVAPRGGNEVHGLETPLVDAEVWAAETASEPSAAGHLVVGSLATEQGRHRFAQSVGSESIVLIDQAFVDDLRSALAGVVSR